MQRLRYASQSADAERCAKDILGVVPEVMQYIRRQVRSSRKHPFTVPQIRSLIFANVEEEPSLSKLAEHVGLSLPAASRMVDLLVRRGLLKRESGSGDRRRVSLATTARGRSEFQRARGAAAKAMSVQLAGLTPTQRSVLSEAMRLLSGVFTPRPWSTKARKNGASVHAADEE